MSTTQQAHLRWDLSKLYWGPDDPQIDTDLARAHQEAEAFRTRYYGKVHTLSTDALREALVAQEAFSDELGKLGGYASLAFSANTQDEAIKSLLARVRVELTELMNAVQFFDLELQSVPDDAYKAYLEAPVLANYHYHLERLKKYAPHTLSEGEERVLAIKDVSGLGAWSQLYTEISAGLKVSLELPDGPREVTVAEARALRSDPDRRVRDAATVGVYKTYAAQSHVLTYIFNTIYEDHRQTLQLRNYDDPMAPTLLDEDLEPEVIEALMSAVESHYPLVQRYYRTKAKVLGISDFGSHDTLAPYSEVERQVPYEEARRIVLDCFASFSPAFSERAKGFFEEAYIDVPPAPGKQSGAFCSGMRPGMHPYVLLNYTNRLDDVMTLAHELGHGVHFMLAGEHQTLANYFPILPLAETASTFAELITVNRLLALETDPLVRRQLLAARIEDAVTTIMRQVMYTRWEQRAHALRAKGVVAPEEYCRLWLEGNQAVYGDAVKRSDWDQWGWITIPHLVQYRFYCYSYAFGQLLVYALYQQYREEGEAFVPKLLDVLSAGGSAPASVILRRVNVDIKDPAFWQKGLALLAGMLEEFEAAV
ncbi:MAG TPA: M3 family oligoendopeptidase [Oscillatoriaceae cyanobacterium]